MTLLLMNHKWIIPHKPCDTWNLGARIMFKYHPLGFLCLITKPILIFCLLISIPFILFSYCTFLLVSPVVVSQYSKYNVKLWKKCTCLCHCVILVPFLMFCRSVICAASEVYQNEPSESRQWWCKLNWNGLWLWDGFFL